MLKFFENSVKCEFEIEVFENKDRDFRALENLCVFVTSRNQKDVKTCDLHIIEAIASNG